MAWTWCCLTVAQCCQPCSRTALMVQSVPWVVARLIPQTNCDPSCPLHNRLDTATHALLCNIKSLSCRCTNTHRFLSGFPPKLWAYIHCGICIESPTLCLTHAFRHCSISISFQTYFAALLWKLCCFAFSSRAVQSQIRCGKDIQLCQIFLYSMFILLFSVCSRKKEHVSTRSFNFLL